MKEQAVICVPQVLLWSKKDFEESGDFADDNIDDLAAVGSVEKGIIIINADWPHYRVFLSFINEYINAPAENARAVMGYMIHIGSCTKDLLLMIDQIMGRRA